MKNHVEEIASFSKAIVKAWNERDYEAFMEQMDADAILLPNGDAPIVGIDAIRSLYKTYFESFNFIVNETIDEITVCGAFAYVVASWEGSMNPVDGSSPISYNNKLITIYKKQADNTWRIYRNIYNSSNPL